MLTTYYFAMVIAAVVGFLCLIVMKGKTLLETNFLFIFIILLTANCGFYALAMSETLSEAILALKITYVSGCFVMPIFLNIIFDMCNVEMPRLLRLFVWGLSLGVFSLVLTIGNNQYYYKSAEIINVDGCTVLLREYSSLHILFPIIMVAYTVVEIAFTIYAIQKKKNVSYKNLLIMLAAEFATVAQYIISRIHEFKYISLDPLFFVIAELVMLYMVYRLRFYSLSDALILSLESQKTKGYITLDTKGNFLNGNDVARSILPELEKCRVDSPVPSDDPVLVNLLKWQEELKIKVKFRTKGGDQKEIFLTKELNAGRRHYKCRIKPAYLNTGAIGAFFYEFTDNTTEYNYNNLLSSYNVKLEETVKEKTEHIAGIRLQMVLGMADVIESRDDITGGHVKRTSDIVAIMVRHIQEFRLFGLSQEFCEDIIKAAPMHDLGKIAIPDDILTKKGKLTPEEFETMKTHAEKGAELVKNLLEDVEEHHFVEVVENIARYHHERWDGSGYPTGIKGKQIPIESRIMAIADVYDALVSKRSYKEQVSFEEAYKIIMDSMGSHFDPDLSLIFELSHKEFEEYYKKAEEEKTAAAAAAAKAAAVAETAANTLNIDEARAE